MKSENVVVKIGSNALTGENGMLDISRIRSLTEQVAALRKKGIRFTLITSGAVAAGPQFCAAER